MTAFFSHASLAFLVFALVVAGLGVPFPEDVVLLLAGALAHRAHLPIAVVVFLCALGVLGGDLLLYSTARRLGAAALERGWLGRLLTEPRRRRMHELFERHGARVVFVARHVAGLRAPVFATAGMNRMRVRVFVLWDGLGICISVPVMVALGYAFSDHVDRIRAGIAHVEHWALAILGAGLATYALANGAGRIWAMIRSRASQRGKETQTHGLLVLFGAMFAAAGAHAQGVKVDAVAFAPAAAPPCAAQA